MENATKNIQRINLDPKGYTTEIRSYIFEDAANKRNLLVDFCNIDETSTSESRAKAREPIIFNN